MSEQEAQTQAPGQVRYEEDRCGLRRPMIVNAVIGWVVGAPAVRDHLPSEAIFQFSTGRA